MTRQRLPSRREGYTFEVPHPDPRANIKYTVKLGFHEGAVKEVFISCNKLTTAMHVGGIEIATLVSIALQHGASLEELAAAMPREEDVMAAKIAKANGEPEPPLVPQGAAGAVLDAIIKELAWLKAPPAAAIPAVA